MPIGPMYDTDGERSVREALVPSRGSASRRDRTRAEVRTGSQVRGVCW